MDENKFEKQVQQKMDELRLHPSGFVWDKIEEQLQKKKRRRVVAFLFSIAALCLIGYSGYLISSHSSLPSAQPMAKAPASNLPSRQPVPVTPATGTDNRSAASDPANAPEQRGRDLQEKRNDLAVKPEIASSAATHRLQQQEREISTASGNAIAGSGDEVLLQRNTSHKKKNRPVAEDFPADNSQSAGTGDKLATVNGGNAKPPAAPGEKINQANGVANDANAVSPDTIAMAQAALPAGDTQLLSTTQAKTGEKAPAGNAGTKKAFRWLIEASPGLSSQWKTASTMKSISYSAPSGPTGNISNPIPAATFNSPSQVKAGASFRLGILAEWQVTTKSRLHTGLQYVYMSNSIKVGNYKDSSGSFNNSYGAVMANSVYRGIPRNTFTNRYHYLQIPLLYQFQLNKSKKLPLLWENGVSVSYLLATNGLLYDSGLGGIYYHNRDAFNRVSLNLHTSFALRFGSGDKWSWSVGPEFSLGTGRVAKDGYDKDHKQLYGGITGRVLLR